MDTLSSTTRNHQRSASFYRRVAIAPLCLCLVAGLHVYRVLAEGQTPWKGGGFGMFSSVDAETSRYLRCYLVTEQGHVPIAVPVHLSRRAIELRAAPSLSEATEMARRLAELRWERRADREAFLAEQIRHLPPNEPLSAKVLQENARYTDDRSASLRPGSMIAAEAIIGDSSENSGIPFSAVRVEVWRFRFDEKTNRLVGEQLLAADEHREPIVGEGQ